MKKNELAQATGDAFQHHDVGTDISAVAACSNAQAQSQSDANLYLATLNDLRRSRLSLLIQQRADGNATQFAEALGYSRSQMYQFLSPAYNDGRSIGELAARMLENRAGLQFGWLDQPLDSDCVTRKIAGVYAATVPATAGTRPPKAIGGSEHAEVIRQVDEIRTISNVSAPAPIPEFAFDVKELQPGERYAGIVNDGGIYRHLIVLPALAHNVTWQQAKTFAAAVGGELPDMGDYDVLLQNLQAMFSGEDPYWSSEWLNRAEAMYLDFGQDPFRDWDSVDSTMSARAIRRIYAGHEEAVVISWHARMKQAREAAGMKRNRLAELIGVSPATITQWESGQTRTITGPNLINACAVLNVDPAWLLGADDE